MGDGGEWFWTVSHPDGATAKSPTGFKTLKECTDNANANGYVVWKPEEERRRGSRS